MVKHIIRMDPEDRKELIYSCAKRLAIEHGGKITRSMIAKECDISAGLINKYFGSGYSLITSVLSDIGNDITIKQRILRSREERKLEILKWAANVVENEGKNAITNRRIMQDCEIGTYRVYLLFGGVMKLREQVSKFTRKNHE